MSEEDSPQPSVCENFEPQAWRKTVCRNCFQPPEVHVAGSGENGDGGTSGMAKNTPAFGQGDKSAASSLKNKFEQLEKDKYKPKETSNTLPRAKKTGGLSLFTDKYDQLDREATKSESPTKGIPPPTPPKTYKKDGSMKGKFGSMENVSVDLNDGSENKLSFKLKFGSMENISLGQEKKKDTVLKHKENISSSNKIDPRQAMLSKLDSFQNELKSGAMSKAGQTVIHKQKDGNVDIITLPKRGSDSNTADSKTQSKDTAVKLNEKTDLKSKFEKPELKSTSSKDTGLSGSKDAGLSKFGQKSKFDLKSPESEKPNELKSGKDLLLSNRFKSTKTDDSKDKQTDKPADKDAKSGWKKPELKPPSKEKEEIKPASLKDRLSKPTDRQKTDETKKPGSNLKDQLKSTSVDKDPLSKLKDKLKSPTAETDNKQAPSWKDRLKSSSADAEKKSDIQSKFQKSETKTDTKSVDEISKLKSPINNEKKLVHEDGLKSPIKTDKKQAPDEERKSPIKIDKKQVPDEERKSPIKTDKKQVPDEERKSPIKSDKNRPSDEERKSPIKTGKKQEPDEGRKSPIKNDKKQVPDEERKSPIKTGKKQEPDEGRKSPIKNDKKQVLDEERKSPIKTGKNSALDEERKSPIKIGKKQEPDEERKSPIKTDKKSTPDEERKSPIKIGKKQEPDVERKSPIKTDKNSAPDEGRKSPIKIGKKQEPDEERKSPIKTDKNSAPDEERESPIKIGKKQEPDEERKSPIKNDKKQVAGEERKSPIKTGKKQEPDEERKSPIKNDKKHASDEETKSPVSNEKKETPSDEKKSLSNNDKKTGSSEMKSEVSLKKDKESTDKNAIGSKFDDKNKLRFGEKSKFENDSKSQDKNISNDLKSKFSKPGLKSVKDEDTSSKPKPFDLRNSLKKASDAPSVDKDPAKVDTKKKFELPSLKSNKNTPLSDKSKNTDNKANIKDEKASNKIGNKFEPKFKLNKTNEPKSNVIEEKPGAKAKFELPKLKSKHDQQDDSKSSLKSKFEPKSKLTETKTDSKNKFEIPSLKKTKAPEIEQKVEKDKPVEIKDSKGKENTTDTKISSKDAEKSTDEVKTSKNIDSVHDFQLNSETNKNENRNTETSEETSLDKNTPVTSVISDTTSFEIISSDSEVVSGDACAEPSTRDTKSPLHVDTQVFTSSRSKTAGVSSLDDSNFDDNSPGFSSLGLTKSNKNKSPPKEPLVNGDIVLEHFNGSTKTETKDNDTAIGSKSSDDELERLRAELLNMTERSQNLETENEMLRSDLNKKSLAELAVKKQKDEVESAINGLRGQLKSMEDKCSQLESENINMMNDLKSKHDVNQSKPHTKESEELDDKLTAKERLMEDLMEENDQLKQEINELKVEMEEMYDSFRDQEAEEFREIQKELEYTAKNCRILQFKLRKMERRNDQTEQDKNQFEERLRKLQNSFQDRDAVSHIHSLEDELRLAKEVSVRLHDELDLMEDRRGKVEEENRHLTELLEQSDRKQFRLELEVDKLRDKVVELRQELRIREEPGEPRKVNLALIGKQTSLEHEISELKRELYDGKERELDMKDQLQFVENNGKKLQKKVQDLEEENDNLSKQIKKLSIERSTDPDTAATNGTDKKETNFELKIQLELSEKELSVLKKNMNAMDEENELLHREMFVLEKRLKDQERQLRIIPEPTSPKSYYEVKMKDYEKEANEFRSKLLDKENEIERLYAQVQTMHSQTTRGKGLRKCRSLDMEESDYNLVVDLRRQVEMCHQENEALKERIGYLKEDKSCLMDELMSTKSKLSESGDSGLTGLAVAYVETETDDQMESKLQQLEASRTLLLHKIKNTVKNIQSLSETHLPKHLLEHLLNIAKTSHIDDIIESHSDSDFDNTPSSGVGKINVMEHRPGNPCVSNDFTSSETQLETGKYHCSLNDAEVSDSLQTINESRDLDKLLSVIEQYYSVLVKRLSETSAGMDSDEGKVVPISPEGVNGHMELPVEEIVRRNEANATNSFENKMSKFSENLAKEIIQSLTCPKDRTPEREEIESEMELSCDEMCKNDEMTETVNLNQDEKVLSPDEHLYEDNELSRKYYKDKIAYLDEEVDDLRMIIKSKEEKNVLLDEEVEELQTYVKKLQDDSRRREMELLSEMDLIHGKNEILNNLLEIVQDRAEAAEDELERVITEINEAQDSSSISSEKSNNSTAPTRDSDGSDDVFEGSPVDKAQVTAFWEEQFKKRIRSLETLLAEERKKSSSLIKQLEITGTDVIASAMSDDAKLRMREKELLQSELQESQKHAVLANDQIRSLTDKLKKVETERWRSPKLLRKPQGSASSDDTSSEEKRESYCRTCADLQTVKNQLSDELLIFKSKAEELEIKIEEINEIWISKSAASEREKQGLEQKLAQKSQDVKRLEEQINKLREEDRMKDIFMKERDNNLKDKTAQITRKDEIIQEQEDIIRQREEDLQSLFDQISQREKTIKELTETVRVKEQRIKEKENALKQMVNNIEEKNEELHYLEEEVHDSVLKRKESESMIAELQTKIEETLKVEKTEIETENERLQSDIENLMGNISELHTDKVTLQNELDKAKHALSEAMLMWERDRSSLGAELSIAKEKMRLMDETAKKKESEALQMLRREVHSIIESREKLVHELRLNKMEHENMIRILKTEKFKLTEELTSKIRMLTHEMNNNDKMSDELTKLRGQDDINYQLHHHEKILRAEYMAMKVRYETQLDRLQKEHMQLLEVVLKLQKEKNLDHEIITGIQKGMVNIKENYTTDLSRWKDERTVLTSHISQIEEGKEIAQHLRAQIDALKRQLTDQDVERTDLVNKMTSERRNWEVDRAQQTSRINQLEEQLALFVQAQSKSKDVQYRMEVAWEKERAEQKRLLNEAHSVAMDLQEQLSRRDEENTREKKNLLEQLDRHRKDYDDEKMSRQKMTLEMNTGETRVKHLEKQMEDMREKQKKELDSWTTEKGQLLRRLAEMRKLHLRDVRRIDDVLAALKRLRELATIVIDSDNSATLPSNGSDDTVRCGDASAASASVHSNENDNEMTDLKQNIDQVILKYVKESLRQIHFLTEELARPSTDLSREEKQTLRRSLSSSEIELLKDEFLLGPQETGRVIPEVKLPDSGREHSGIQRQITHDGTTINSDRVQPDYIENILMEQSSFYNDAKDAHIEVHRVKTTRDITRVETKVTSLPKPPPSFIIPRSRSTSPGPSTLGKGKQVSKPVLKSMSLESTHSHRLSAPVTGASSRSSSTDSSPVGNYNFIPSSEGNGLGVAGPLQSGSLDRLSPSTARKRFFEAQPNNSANFMSWPERRKRELNPNRNSRSLTGSTELFISESNDDITGNGKLRNSVSMDDGSIGVEPSDSHRTGSGEGAVARSRSAENASKHSGLRDMFMAMKKRLRPKVKRSQSAREHDKIQRLQAVKEIDKADKNEDNTNTPVPESSKLKSDSSVRDDSHVTQDQLTPINIPDDETKQRTSRASDRGKKNKSRSRSPAEKDDTHGSQSTLQRIKNRFRSKSADRARDHREHHVTPILVGHTTTAQAEDQQYSETCV